MKAISIRQPWAWAIIYAGKDVENRTWHTDYRGPLLIHAGKKFDIDGFEWIAENFAFPMPRKHQFMCGGIIGMATLKNVVRQYTVSPWFFGPWGFRLIDPKPVPFVPLKGKLGIFDVNVALPVSGTLEAQNQDSKP